MLPHRAAPRVPQQALILSHHRLNPSQRGGRGGGGGRGGIAGQPQRHRDAARAWELYLAIDPGNFEAHMQLGSHLLMAGEADKAAASLRAALELQPDSARAYQALGDVYARAQQSDQAVLHYRKALEAEPGNVRSHLALGEGLP